METLKEMGPSQIDSEIRCLAPEGGGSVAVMVRFLHMVDWALKTCRDYELAQAYLALFLKVNHYTIYHVKPGQNVIMKICKNDLIDVAFQHFAVIFPQVDTCQ